MLLELADSVLVTPSVEDAPELDSLDEIVVESDCSVVVLPASVVVESASVVVD